MYKQKTDLIKSMKNYKKKNMRKYGVNIVDFWIWIWDNICRFRED